jgi:hypothetical protein
VQVVGSQEPDLPPPRYLKENKLNKRKERNTPTMDTNIEIIF